MGNICAPIYCWLSASPLCMSWSLSMKMTASHTWAKSDVCICVGAAKQHLPVPSLAPWSNPPEARGHEGQVSIWGENCPHLEKCMGLLKFRSSIHPLWDTVGTLRWEKMKPDNHWKLPCINGVNFLHPWRKRKRRTHQVFKDQVVLWSAYELRFSPPKFSPVLVYSLSVTVCLFFYSTNINWSPTIYIQDTVLGPRDRSVKKTDISSCIEEKRKRSQAGQVLRLNVSLLFFFFF